MTDRVGKWKCYFKKHKGRTFNEIFVIDKGYLIWLYENIKNLNSDIREWIEIKCEDDICDSCHNSRISYWSDGIYGTCMDCSCINCGKLGKNCNCKCI